MGVIERSQYASTLLTAYRQITAPFALAFSKKRVYSFSSYDEAIANMKSLLAPIAAILIFPVCIPLYAADPVVSPTTISSEAISPMKVSASTPAPMEYRPSMPDMMNIGVQSRHQKLGIAGHERNWKYSAYEVRELRTAFTRIARTAPAHDGWDTQAMFNSMIMTPITKVEDAIKAADGRMFDANYAALTEACNACHIVMGRDYIVIQVPR